MSVPSIYRRTYYRQPTLTTRELGPCRFAQRRGLKDALLPSRSVITVTDYALLVDNATMVIPVFAYGTMTLEMHVTAGYVHVPGQIEVDLTAAASNTAAAAAIATAITTALAAASLLAEEASTCINYNATVSLLSWDQAGRVGAPITGTAAGVTYQQRVPEAYPTPLPFPVTVPVYPFVARSGPRRQFRQVFPAIFTFPGPS